MEGDLERIEAHGTISEIGDEVSNQTETPGSILATSIRQKLETMSPLSSICCIHRVPRMLRSLNDAAYTPRVISIGPFHRRKESLLAMEEHKWRYLRDFLDRYPQKDLEDYVEALRGLEKSVRQCYAEPIRLDSDKFVEMMLLDGSFILVLFLKMHFREWQDTSDPIFYTDWMRVAIMLDLLLVENQIPFFVLQCLFHLSPISDQDNACPYLLQLIPVSYYLLKINEIPERIYSSQVKHLLDFVQSCHLPSSMLSNGEMCSFTCSATELHDAGVKFRVNNKCLLHISFENGVLEIPFLQIDDTTETFFRNLIAWEQFQNLPYHGIASYASLMDSLINTPKDVDLLICCGIIENYLGDNEDVSRLFNNLLKEVALGTEKFYFSSVCRNLNAHYKMRRHRWIACWHKFNDFLKNNYFNTQLAIISFGAAVVLLILTFIQTVCSLISLKY